MGKREVKFRGMSLGGKWFHGDLAQPKNDISTSVKGGGAFISNEYGMPHAYPVRPETVGQYVDVRDQDGVEIYEGDILEVTNEWSETSRHTVFWGGEDYPAFDMKPELSDEINSICEMVCGDYQYKVVGNIYDNKELLNVSI